MEGPSVLPQWIDPSLAAFLFMLNHSLLNQIGDFHCQPRTQLQYKGDPVRLLPPNQCLLFHQKLLPRDILGEHTQKKTLLFLVYSQLLFLYHSGPNPFSPYIPNTPNLPPEP